MTTPAAIRNFLQAAELIDEQSQISISEQLSTLTVNEWLADYRGEYSERLWVHSYLMMNFLLLNDPQSAAVEARRALKVLDRYPSELQEAYFTRALGGLSFETVGLINDAYLEYRVLADQLDDPTPVANRLSRFASQLGIDDSAQTYRDYVDVSSANANPANGELIVFLSQGRIPRKIPGDLFIPPDIRFSWPQYSNYQSWPVEVDVSLRESQADYSLVYSNLGNLARTSLAARGKSIAVRQTVRAVAKHNIVNEVEDQNPLVGGLLQIALFALENADTRGWDTLPGHLGLLRISLPPGEHQVQLMDGNVLLLDFPSVTIRAGEKTFHKVRL